MRQIQFARARPVARCKYSAQACPSMLSQHERETTTNKARPLLLKGAFRSSRMKLLPPSPIPLTRCLLWESLSHHGELCAQVFNTSKHGWARCMHIATFRDPVSAACAIGSTIPKQVCKKQLRNVHKTIDGADLLRHRHRCCTQSSGLLI